MEDKIIEKIIREYPEEFIMEAETSQEVKKLKEDLIKRLEEDENERKKTA